MPRQVRAKELAIQKTRPYSTAGGVHKKVGVGGCKARNGPTMQFQNIRKLSNKFSGSGLMPETSSKEKAAQHAANVLAAMGIGRVDNYEIDENPRSVVDTKLRIRSDFSLLKVETDITKIPNPQIFDKKSLMLKRGEVKLIKATELIKFPVDANEPFFKPDDELTISNKIAVQNETRPDIRWAPVMLQTMFVDQLRTETKLMSPYFRIAFRQYGYNEPRIGIDAVNWRKF